MAQLILVNGRITTLSAQQPEAAAVAISAAISDAWCA